jgi:hypothetical protein
VDVSASVAGSEIQLFNKFALIERSFLFRIRLNLLKPIGPLPTPITVGHPSGTGFCELDEPE